VASSVPVTPDRMLLLAFMVGTVTKQMLFEVLVYLPEILDLIPHDSLWVLFSYSLGTGRVLLPLSTISVLQ
jgi:hypothetical protein